MLNKVDVRLTGKNAYHIFLMEVPRTKSPFKFSLRHQAILGLGVLEPQEKGVTFLS